MTWTREDAITYRLCERKGIGKALAPASGSTNKGQVRCSIATHIWPAILPQNGESRASVQIHGTFNGCANGYAATTNSTDITQTGGKNASNEAGTSRTQVTN